jgi:hypothetical protein
MGVQVAMKRFPGFVAGSSTPGNILDFELPKTVSTPQNSAQRRKFRDYELD